MKNKKRDLYYRKIKDGLVIGAGSGLLAGMIFIGSSSSSLGSGLNYQNTSRTSRQSVTGMHIMRKWNSRSKIGALTANLGLSKDYVSSELVSGKSVKQILYDNGINTNELDKAFNGRSRHKSWKKYNITG